MLLTFSRVICNTRRDIFTATEVVHCPFVRRTWRIAPAVAVVHRANPRPAATRPDLPEPVRLGETRFDQINTHIDRISMRRL